MTGYVHKTYILTSKEQSLEMGSMHTFAGKAGKDN